MGYWLGQQYTGQGIMTHAAGQLIVHGFAELGLSTIEICCHPDNSPSRSVADRLGFTCVGRLRDMEEVTPRLVDQLLYRRTGQP